MIALIDNGCLVGPVDTLAISPDIQVHPTPRSNIYKLPHILSIGTFSHNIVMPERTVLRKDQLEISLHNEQKLIKEGTIKDDNPLDLSEPFRELCNACRKGDLKVCQEKITEGVNINARDPYDYTPLILVSA